jgi:hypothetical protein
MDAFIGLAGAYTKEITSLPSFGGGDERKISARSESVDRPSSPTRNRPQTTEGSGKSGEGSAKFERPSSARNRPNSPESHGNQDPCAGLELGRLGFKKLILDGKLLGLPKGTADASYESVDSDASGCVSFSEVWTWFIYQARVKSRRSPGSVQFQLETILSPKERAITALMKRFVK